MPRKHARIVKHHRNSSVYVEGRYLHVDTKISTRSKRGREIARETAHAILNEVGTSEDTFSVLEQVTTEDQHRGAVQQPSADEPELQNVAHPNDAAMFRDDEPQCTCHDKSASGTDVPPCPIHDK